MKTALIVVDVQKDFCEGGALPVPGGHEVATKIREYVRTSNYDLIVTSRDWHQDWSDNQGHFSRMPDYADTWPVHCVAGTVGAEYVSELYYPPKLQACQSKPQWADIEVLKGRNSPAYSAFEGRVEGTLFTLEKHLRARQIKAVDVCGLALDHCVRATVLDSLTMGFVTKLLLNLTAAVYWETGAIATAQMAIAGAEIFRPAIPTLG